MKNVNKKEYWEATIEAIFLIFATYTITKDLVDEKTVPIITGLHNSGTITAIVYTGFFDIIIGGGIILSYYIIKGNNWLKDIKINNKTIVIAIYLLILLLSFFYNSLIFIIIVSFSILIISGIFPILYYVQLMKQRIPSEDYYLNFVEKHYPHMDEQLLIKMFEIKINNERNFLFSYLALLGAFTFAIISNRDYFKATEYGFLNLYYWNIIIGIIGILVLVYATYGFNRYTLKELEILFKAKEKLKQLKGENISPPVT